MSFSHTTQIVVEYILPLELNEMKTSLHIKVDCWVCENGCNNEKDVVQSFDNEEEE